VRPGFGSRLEIFGPLPQHVFLKPLLPRNFRCGSAILINMARRELVIRKPWNYLPGVVVTLSIDHVIERQLRLIEFSLVSPPISVLVFRRQRTEEHFGHTLSTPAEIASAGEDAGQRIVILGENGIE